MNKKNSNPCTRCGEERVVIKTFEEVVGNSTILHTITSCPNPKCQEKVDKILSDEKAKRTSIKVEAQKRDAHRHARIHNA